MPTLQQRRIILGARPFSPLDIPGLKLWLAADRITGLADGAAVTSWSDLSGNGNHLTQAVGGRQPIYKTNIINGLPVVRFDGIDDILINGSPTGLPSGDAAFTMYLVVKQATGTPPVTNFPFAFCLGTNPNLLGMLYVGGLNGPWKAAHHNGNEAIGTTSANAGFAVVRGKYTGSAGTWTIAVNGGVEGTQAETGGAPNFASTSISIGADDTRAQPFGGDIAEALFYARATTPAEDARIGAYLG